MRGCSCLSNYITCYVSKEYKRPEERESSDPPPTVAPFFIPSYGVSNIAIRIEIWRWRLLIPIHVAEKSCTYRAWSSSRRAEHELETHDSWKRLTSTASAPAAASLLKWDLVKIIFSSWEEIFKSKKEMQKERSKEKDAVWEGLKKGGTVNHSATQNIFDRIFAMYAGTKTLSLHSVDTEVCMLCDRSILENGIHFFIYDRLFRCFSSWE